MLKVISWKLEQSNCNECIVINGRRLLNEYYTIIKIFLKNNKIYHNISYNFNILIYINKVGIDICDNAIIDNLIVELLK